MKPGGGRGKAEEGSREWRAQQAREARERMAELSQMLQQMNTLEKVLGQVPGKKLYATGLLMSEIPRSAKSSSKNEEGGQPGDKIRSEPELVIEELDAVLPPAPLGDSGESEESGGSTARHRADEDPEAPSLDPDGAQAELGDGTQEEPRNGGSTARDQMDDDPAAPSSDLDHARGELGDDTEGGGGKQRPSTAAALLMLGGGQKTRSYRKELQLQKSLARLQHSGTREPEEYRIVEPIHISETVDKSFRIFRQSHPLRLICWATYKSRIMRGLFLLTAVANSVLIALSPENIDAVTLREWDVGGVLPVEDPVAAEAKLASAWSRIFRWVDLFDVVCVFVLFAEVAIGMTALGVWAPRRKCLSWLTCSSHHGIDLFVLCFAVAEYALILLGFKAVTLRPLRLLRLLTLLGRLPFFSGVNTILETLYQGMGQVLTVLAVLLFLWAALSIFGMAMYQNSFRRYCALAPSDVPFTACASLTFSASSCPDPRLASEPAVLSGLPSVVGGGYPFRRPCKMFRNTSAGQWDGVYPLSRAGLYHTCVGSGGVLDAGFSAQECVVGANMGGNSSSPFGFVHFDHAGGAMLALAQYSLTDAGYDVLHASLSSEPGWTQGLTYTFYIVTSALCTFLCLGLFVAVVTGTFHRVGLEKKQTESGVVGLGVKERRRSEARHRSRKFSTFSSVDREGQESGLVNADQSKSGASLRAEMNTQGADGGSFTVLGQRFGAVNDVGDQAGVVRADAATVDEEGGSDRRLDVGRENGTGGVETGVEGQFGATGVEGSEQRQEIEGSGDVEKGRDDEGQVAVKDSSNLLGRFLKASWWNHLASLVIFAHVFAMSCDQYDASEAWIRFVFISYVGCNSFFGLELLLKLIAAGPRGFWQHLPNRGGVVVSSCALAGMLADIKVLQLIPAVRLYRLMRYVPTLEGLLLSTVTSSSAIANLLIFIVTTATCFGVAGRYVIGNEMDNITRSNFGTFQSSLLTIFQIFTGDSWSSVLFGAMYAKQNIWGQISAAVLILSWLAFARLICSNLFVAVIIENFRVSETISNIQKAGTLSAVRKTYSRAWRQLYRRRNANAVGALHLDPVNNDLYALPRESSQAPGSADVSNDEEKPDGGEEVQNQVLAVPPSEEEAGQRRENRQERLDQKSPGSGEQGTRLPEQHRLGPAEERTVLKTLQVLKTRPSQEERVSMEDIPNLFKSDTIKLLTHQKGIRMLDKRRRKPQRVLFLFSPQNSVRRFFVHVDRHPIFNACVYLAILASCMVLIISPAYKDIPGSVPLLSEDIVSISNLVFAIVFSVEFLCKVMSHGLIQPNDAYLRSAWNWVDFVVLVFSWVDEAAVFEKGYIARIARLFRALRPLRLMKRNVAMRVVIDALISTLPPVGYVIVFACFNFVVFAVIGMGILGGRLYRCSLPGAEYPQGLAECSGTHARAQDGLLLQRVWDNPGYSFDSVAESIMVLFQINTLKYVQVLESVMDVTDINKSPVQNTSGYYALFIVVYIIVGSLFVMNLFVGFIVDGFHANKGDSKADVLFTRFLRQLFKLRRRGFLVPPPSNRISTGVRRFVETRAFQLWSVFCVSANVVVMLTDHASASEEFETFMEIQNLVFLIELCVEVLLQATAYGPKGFFRDKWRVFDLCVALGTGCGYLLDDASITQFSKGFRLMRVIRLMRMFSPVRIILETLIYCLPQLANILLLLFLVYSIFAVIAVQLYSTTQFGQRLGPTANFQTFFRAMLTFYQIITGEEWHVIMADCSVVPPSCTEQFDGFSFGDCGSQYSFVFFAASKIVCESVMLNLFIGMILDNFSFITEEVSHVADARWTNGPSAQQLAQLAVHFQRFDAGTGRMPLIALRSFMSAAPQPLGLRGARGAIAYGKMERAAEKLVRAELLLCVREDHVEAKRWSQRIRRVFWRERDRFNVSVSFEEVVMTLLYWRLPEMTPDLVKLSRQDRVRDVIETVHMFVLKDFLLNLVARRKAREQNFGKTVK